MLRNALAGELRPTHVGSTVRLAGWVARRRDHGNLIFVDVRDRSGLVQLVFDPSKQAAAHALAETLRSEYVIAVSGTVVARSPETVNPNLASGAVEVAVAAAELLNAAKTPPFGLEEEDDVADETLRLRYRYLDLRRPRLLANLELRHKAVQAARAYLNEQRFLEVETPYLTKSSPEGARDFLVPSRLQTGKFYALPQSPQMFKQILMVAGVDRYYQIARCFRDEDLRADRQPEHTQIDAEMSFMSAAEIRALLEGLMAAMFAGVGEEPPLLPLPTLTYDEAMLRYGSDKPDLRYGFAVDDLTDMFGDSGFQVFRGAVVAGGVVRAIRAPGGAALSRAQIDRLTDHAKENGAKGMAYVFVEEGRTLRGPIVKFLSPDEQTAIVTRTQAEAGDLVVFAADQAAAAAKVLGALRLQLIALLAPAPTAPWALLWVVDFPLFEIDSESGRLTYGHNPFSLPTDETLAFIDSEPLKVRGAQYDLVLNGVELGSGSLRNHRADLQRRVLHVLGYDDERIEAAFGWFLEALDYGAPPHGGIGLGLDRIVTLLAGESSIREMIAFPKTASGADLMTGAPGVVDAGQLKELRLRLG
ncbi:MAG: aspartate--tRNA ligase [Thermoleophilia bacterium]